MAPTCQHTSPNPALLTVAAHLNFRRDLAYFGKTLGQLYYNDTSLMGQINNTEIFLAQHCKSPKLRKCKI